MAKAVKPSKVKSPHVRRKPLPTETLDCLDKYDPDSESEQFHNMLSGIMASTSTIMTDPRMDPRDLKLANNYHEWLTGADFLNFAPYARQVDIGLQLNLDVCWRCSPDYYDGPDINFKWHYAEMRKRYQLMNLGVCPVCKATREQGVRKGYIYDKYLHTGCAGQRSSKCLLGNTLVSTPDGPIEIRDFIGKVRLVNCDTSAVMTKQNRSYVYHIETDSGINISPNARHRMFTAELGYTYVAKGNNPVKVGMHFEIPKVTAIEKTITAYDSMHRLDGRNEALSMFARINEKNKTISCREVWKKPYAYKESFFKQVAKISLLMDVSVIYFELQSEALGSSLRAWFESTGVECYPMYYIPRRSVPSSPEVKNKYRFMVNIRDFLRNGPDILNPSLQKHYWKINPDHTLTLYPAACSKLVATPLKELLSDLGRFHWEKYSPQQTRLTELYSIWSTCKQGSSLTTSRIVHILKLLRPWQHLLWTKNERKEYERLIAVLQWLLRTRFTKITKITRSKEKQDVYDLSVPGPEWFVANSLHSHNSVLTGHNIGYTIHRLIRTGDPAAYYSLLPGTVLTCILTATTMQNAERNLYTPMRNMFTMMPWFQVFEKWCKEREAEMGIELFKIRENFTFFRYGGLDIRTLSPDRRRIRGSTSFATATDELGHFDAEDDKGSKVRASGLEVYGALSASLTNVLGAALKMREAGDNDVIFPCSHAVSSPFDMNDPITILRKQHMKNNNAVTYNIPTWKFNPNLTFEMCRAIALPATFMRDYGCEVTSTTGTFFDRAEVLIDLCDDNRNAVKTFTEVFTSRSGATYTIGKLKFRGTASEDMVTGLCLDASFNNNSYAFLIFHIETDEPDPEEEGNDDDDDESEDVNEDEDNDSEETEDVSEEDEESLDTYRVVVDAIGEIQPSKTNPIHFTQNVKHVLYPLIEKFNVQVVLSDRWQTLQTQQDVMDDMGITAVPITPKMKDFLTFRQSIYDQSFLLPKCEMEIEDVVALQGPSDFVDAPVAHLLRQCLTVKETPKTVEKGAVFSDDLFRVCVLAHMARMEPEIRNMLITEEEIESDGVASMVVGAAQTPAERVNMSSITFSSGSCLVAVDPDAPTVRNEDEDAAATSYVVRR